MSETNSPGRVLLPEFLQMDEFIEDRELILSEKSIQSTKIEEFKNDDRESVLSEKSIQSTKIKEFTNDDEIDFGGENPELNFKYLSSINKDKDTLRKKYYEVIEAEKLESVIPGIFISYEKINEYFMLEYNLKKCKENNKQRIKYKEEKDEFIEIIKDYINKETLIPKIYDYQNSLLEFLCYDLYLFIIDLYYKTILDPTFDKNTNYNDLFSLIRIIVDIEFNIKKNIEKNNFDIFYSLIYFLLSLRKEIFHLLEIYSYIANKFREGNYLKGNVLFFDVFKKNIEEKIKKYQNNEQPLL